MATTARDLPLLLVLNGAGTHAEVSRHGGVQSDPSTSRHIVLAPGGSLYGIGYATWARHLGGTVDLLALQAREEEARARARRAVYPMATLSEGDWRAEPPIGTLPLPAAPYGFSTGRRVIACSREQLVRQCLEAPETPAVWTPESDGLVRPERVGFLVDALRRRRVRDAESQTTLAGALLTALSAIAWLAGAGARSGWMVLCALATAWLVVALYQAGEAERAAGRAFAAAREQHRHALWLEGRPALLTWAILALLVAVMVGQLYAPGDAIEAAGLVKPRVHEGEIWRLLTGALLHGGLLHLGLNALALWSLGPLVEAHGGRPVLPILFVGSALAGSGASLWLLPDAPSVGASGGILGIAGYLFVLGYRRRRSLPHAFVGRVGIGILATGVFGVIGHALVDNAMHAGGLLTGMLLALLLPDTESGPERSSSRIVATVGDVAVAVLMIAAVKAAISF